MFIYYLFLLFNGDGASRAWSIVDMLLCVLAAGGIAFVVSFGLLVPKIYEDIVQQQ
jgi:hypothetical protein